MGEKEGGEEDESQTATDEFETFHASDTDTSEEDSDFDIEQYLDENCVDVKMDPCNVCVSHAYYH